MNEFIAHWTQCNTALAPQALIVRRPDNTTVTQAQFSTLRDTIQARQNTVQACLTEQQITRGNINLKKTGLLQQFNQFTSLLDGYFVNTDFYEARPYAPSLGDGQEAFTRPMADMMSLWEKINDGPAPAGVTLPLILGDGTAHGVFASAVSALQFTYASERVKAQDLALARARRNRLQSDAYEVMKAYREAVAARMTAHPDLNDTIPRLSPLPGHTPEPVNASAIFQAPNASKIVHAGSNDLMVESYELRGNVGDRYSDDDAVVIDTHTRTDPREFVTTFGLTQPGAQVAFKVFVILTTGNEAGSVAMVVERPANVQNLAA